MGLPELMSDDRRRIDGYRPGGVRSHSIATIAPFSDDPCQLLSWEAEWTRAQALLPLVRGRVSSARQRVVCRKMKLRKVIRKGIDSNKDGIRVAGGVNAVVAANVNEPGSQGMSTSSRQRIVQSSSGTQIHEETVDTSENEGGKDE